MVFPVEITNADSPMPPRETLIECAEASYGLGNRFSVDWERFYEVLETYGFDMQNLGGTIDNRIRRLVQAAVRDGEVC